MKELKWVIFGCGINGKMLADFMGHEKVVAFIDNNPVFQGTYVENIKVCSMEEYLDNYQEYLIAVTVRNNKEIQNQLQEHDIFQYLLLEDCPSEMQCTDTYDIVNNFPYEIENKDYIYGINIFTILLFEYMLKKTGQKIPIIAQKELDEKTIRAIQKKVVDINIIENAKFRGFFDNESVMYISDYAEFDEIALMCKKNNWKYIDIYDMSNRIKNYHNQDIFKFNNIHCGQRIFIVCPGPSLRIEDLDTLNRSNEICISMNSILDAFNETSWKPDYYFCTDTQIEKYYGNEIKSSLIKAKFISNHYMPFWDGEINDSIYKIHAHTAYDSNGLVKFSEDLTQTFYNGGTVTYICIQMAVFMGAKEIYLLGLDFSYNLDKDGYIIPEGSHFKDNRQIPKNVKVHSWLNNHYKCYISAKQYADSHGIKIYNATRGGKLEVFERVDFDSLFDKKERQFL